MTRLVLNRRFNMNNIRLADDGANTTVGYLRRDGSCQYVPWLGFIDRFSAKELKGAQPVRIADISRTGYDDGLCIQWQDLAANQYVYGCLVANGVYGVYAQEVVFVDARQSYTTNITTR